MKVKIGRFWYNSDENDICLEFEPHELEFVKQMSSEENKVAFYNTEDFNDAEKALEWMNE